MRQSFLAVLVVLAVPMHRQMTASMVSQMNTDMRGMNMQSDPRWTGAHGLGAAGPGTPARSTRGPAQALRDRASRPDLAPQAIASRQDGSMSVEARVVDEWVRQRTAVAATRAVRRDRVAHRTSAGH